MNMKLFVLFASFAVFFLVPSTVEAAYISFDNALNSSGRISDDFGDDETVANTLGDSATDMDMHCPVPLVTDCIGVKELLGSSYSGTHDAYRCARLGYKVFGCAWKFDPWAEDRYGVRLGGVTGSCPDELRKGCNAVKGNCYHRRCYLRSSRNHMRIKYKQIHVNPIRLQVLRTTPPAMSSTDQRKQKMDEKKKGRKGKSTTDKKRPAQLKRKQIVHLTSEEDEEVEKEVARKMELVKAGKLPRLSTTSSSSSIHSKTKPVTKPQPLSASSSTLSLSSNREKLEQLIATLKSKSDWTPPPVDGTVEQLCKALSVKQHVDGISESNDQLDKTFKRDFPALIRIHRLYNETFDEKSRKNLAWCVEKLNLVSDSKNKIGIKSLGAWITAYLRTIPKLVSTGIPLTRGTDSSNDMVPSEEAIIWNRHAKRFCQAPSYAVPSLDSSPKINVRWATVLKMREFAETVMSSWETSEQLTTADWRTEPSEEEELAYKKIVPSYLRELIDSDTKLENYLSLAHRLVFSLCTRSSKDVARSYIIIPLPYSQHKKSRICVGAYCGYTIAERRKKEGNKFVAHSRLEEHINGIECGKFFYTNPNLYIFLRKNLCGGRHLYRFNVLPDEDLSSPAAYLVEHLIITFFHEIYGKQFNVVHGNTSRAECELADSLSLKTKAKLGAALFMEATSRLNKLSRPFKTATVQGQIIPSYLEKLYKKSNECTGSGISNPHSLLNPSDLGANSIGGDDNIDEEMMALCKDDDDDNTTDSSCLRPKRMPSHLVSNKENGGKNPFKVVTADKSKKSMAIWRMRQSAPKRKQSEEEAGEGEDGEEVITVDDSNDGEAFTHYFKSNLKQLLDDNIKEIETLNDLLAVVKVNFAKLSEEEKRKWKEGLTKRPAKHSSSKRLKQAELKKTKAEDSMSGYGAPGMNNWNGNDKSAYDSHKATNWGNFDQSDSVSKSNSDHDKSGNDGGTFDT